MTTQKLMFDALVRAQRLLNEAVPKFNYGASYLDANAIRLLNEVPGEVNAAIVAYDKERHSPAVAHIEPTKPSADFYRGLLNDIIASAHAHGYVLSIELEPKQPLAMGNYLMVPYVRERIVKGD